jgi:Holliday junction resolvase RusA-like endonuclease
VSGDELTVQPQGLPSGRLTHEAVLRLTVSGEPVPWARARTAGGSYYTDRRRRDAMDRIAVYARQELGHRPMDDDEGDYVVGVRLYSARRRAFDVDNGGELVLDALNPQRRKWGLTPGIIWRDDRQVYDLHPVRYDRSDNPRTEIVIYRLIGAR